MTSLDDQQRYPVFFQPSLRSYWLALFPRVSGKSAAGVSVLKRRPAIHDMLPTCFLVSSSSSSEPPQPLSLPSTLVLPLSHTHFPGLLRSHPLICTWEPRWWHPRAADEARRCVAMCSRSLSHPSHAKCKTRRSAHDEMSGKDIKTCLVRARCCSPEPKGDSAKVCIYSSALCLPCLLCLFLKKKPFTGAMFTVQHKNAQGLVVQVTLFKTFFGGNIP